MNPTWSYLLGAIGVLGIWLAGRKSATGWARRSHTRRRTHEPSHQPHMGVRPQTPPRATPRLRTRRQLQPQTHAITTHREPHMKHRTLTILGALAVLGMLAMALSTGVAIAVIEEGR